MIDSTGVIASSGFVFKIADEENEFEQIHRLNHRTFVEEIPQHEAQEDKLLKDRFHEENLYVICMRQGQLLGMMAVRDQRPFSLDYKLDDLDSYLPPAEALCEIRLLAIEKSNRHHMILAGLTAMLADVCQRKEYELALVSAVERNIKLYSRLGFVPFAQLVGTPPVQLQPMYLTWQRYEEQWKEKLSKWHK